MGSRTHRGPRRRRVRPRRRAAGWAPARRSGGGRPAGAPARRPPVRGRREDRGGDRDRAQVREQRADRLLQRERMPGRAARRGDEDLLARQRARVEHVEERLEQPVVRAAEQGGDRDQGVGRRTCSMASRSAGDGNPVSRAFTMSWARSRSSIVTTSLPAAVGRRPPQPACRPAAGWTRAGPARPRRRRWCAGSSAARRRLRADPGRADLRGAGLIWAGLGHRRPPPAPRAWGRRAHRSRAFASSSRRSTSTPSPSRSSCSSTVFSGTTA